MVTKRDDNSPYCDNFSYPIWHCRHRWPSNFPIGGWSFLGPLNTNDLVLFLTLYDTVGTDGRVISPSVVGHFWDHWTQTILFFPFLEASAFIACRGLQCIRKPYWLVWNNCNFFGFILVQLFADFQFLAKLLVKEVPQVTERTNEVILCFHIRTTSLCAGCLMWSIFICIYLFIINWFKTSEVVHRFKNLCIYVCISFIYLFIRSLIIFLGLSSLFFRQQCRLSIVVKSRKTPLVVLKTFPKKDKSELLWQLPHFLLFPCSPPVPMLCASFLLGFFNFMFFLARHFFGPQCNRNSKDRIILGSWEPAHLPLP